MWEWACSRKRCISHLINWLTHRIREQARSHILIAFQSSADRAGGKVKPDTDLRNWLAIFARLPMLSAVAVEPDDVCVVIC